MGIYCRKNSYDIFSSFNNADAYAKIKGGPLAPKLRGIALLYQLCDGVYIEVYVCGIPIFDCHCSSFHGFHIHEFGNCIVGDPKNPFQAAGGHWNPTDQPHPYHAGDLPPLLSNNGKALMSVVTDRFKLRDAIGRSFIIHRDDDDFTTQPTGNSGPRLACGVIRSTKC